MDVRGHIAAVSALLVLCGAGPAIAQIHGAALVGPQLPEQQPDTLFRARPMQFQTPQGDLRRPGEPVTNGLIAAVPVAENVEIGIGKFLVPQIARPRTHMESERQPVSVRPSDRGIAAVGVSLRF